MKAHIVPSTRRCRFTTCKHDGTHDVVDSYEHAAAVLKTVEAWETATVAARQARR